jgi:hypothetical protein
MKRKHLFILTVVAFVMAALVASVSYIDLMALIPGIGSGLSLATTGAILGTPTTDKTAAASSELLTNTISKKITEMKPSLTPLDTIIRHMGIVVPVKSWRTDYYAVDIRGVLDKVAEDLTIDVDGDTGEWEPYAEVEVVNINIWNKDDNLVMPGINGGDNLPLAAHVYAINRTLKLLSVIWLNPRPDGGQFQIDEDTEITRIGNSKAELDAQTDPYAVLPQKEFNYSQIHMAQVEQGVYDKLHEKEVNWDISDFQAQSLYDMRRSMEYTSIMGVRYIAQDPVDNDQKYFSGGLFRYITKALDYPSTGIGKDLFIDWSEKIFTGNSGADTRFCFGGGGFISDMSKVETVQKQIEAKKTEVVYGITFQRIETNFGVLLVKHHPLMKDIGMNYGAMVLDMNHIEKHVFKPMDVRELNLDKTGQRRADAYVVDEAFCLALRYPDTHAIIRKLVGDLS